MIKPGIAISALLLAWLFAIHVQAKEGHLMTNRLVGAASPYLRQHAHNPVDWYPWGREAFDRAKKENKPIFLSIGYSTCHWCHVMERESFENKDIAALLNKYFIAIKVDRERRPDVDETYMIATQIITKGGGWPNSLFLTPDLKPFFAGTYFPKEVFGRLLKEVGKQWQENEKALIADGESIFRVINEILTRRVAAQGMTSDVLLKAGRIIMRNADVFYGGFDTSPKFPNEPILMFLLQLAAGHGDKKALETVTRTLDYMLDGGIHDHVGGGFHRYATDNLWRVPHFEKMLYNQAQMVRVLLQAYRLTGKKRYARAAERTISYVLQHMRSQEGGFFSAYDADSGGGEGLYYVWTAAQLKEVLGESDGALAEKIFGVTPEGNFEGRTVLHFPEHPEKLANSLKLDANRFDEVVSRILSRLNKARDRRVAPHLDDKLVLSWNGMMIAAIAEAALVLRKPKYEKVAEKALHFVDKNMKRGDGSYRRSFFEGKAELMAQQEDYAWLALACVKLYDVTGKKEYLNKAEELTAFMIKTFLDPDSGDYFMVAKTDVFVRGKNRSDGATPSGNSVALEVLTLLSHRSRKPEYRDRANALLAALSGLAVESPRSAAYILRGADMIGGRETGEVQYLAKGVVRAQARIDSKANKVLVSLEIAPGWHINAHRPLGKDFIPTSARIESAGASAGHTEYPEAVLRKLEFSNQKMALYEGKIWLGLPLLDSWKGPVQLKVTLQACSRKICLEPAKAILLARE